MITIKYILKNQPLKDGKYRVALRIIKDRKKIVISSHLKCNQKDFQNERFVSSYRGFRKKNKYLRDLKDKVEDIIESHETKGLKFSLTDLRREIFNKNEEEISIWECFEKKIGSKDIKPKTAKAYKDTKNSLKRFHPENLMVHEINSEFLNNYVSYLKSRGSNDGGVKFFLTHLKVIVKQCLKLNKEQRVTNPFTNFSLSKFNKKPMKKALSLTEIKAFKLVDLTDRPDLKDTYKMAIFSFYCRGINFVDMMNLQWTDFSDDIMTYRRSKTGKLYVIKLLKPAMEILNYYKGFNSTGYVFPVVKSNNLTPEQLEGLRHRSLRKFNKELKEIATLCKINTSISSYTMRHTYATVMKKLKTSTDIISESMGHSDVKVTQSYLKEFGNEILDKEHEKLLDI